MNEGNVNEGNGRIRLPDRDDDPRGIRKHLELDTQVDLSSEIERRDDPLGKPPKHSPRAIVSTIVAVVILGALIVTSLVMVFRS